MLRQAQHDTNTIKKEGLINPSFALMQKKQKIKAVKKWAKNSVYNLKFAPKVTSINQACARAHTVANLPPHSGSRLNTPFS